MKNYIPLFQNIAQEIQWTSPNSYTHQDNTEVTTINIPSHGKLDAGMTMKATRHLMQFIYLHYYLKTTNAIDQVLQKKPTETKPIIMLEDPLFTTKLQAANCSTGYASHDWQILSLEPDGIIIQKNGIRLFAQRDEILFTSKETLQCNEIVSLCMPKDAPYMHPGYYTIIGNDGFIATQEAKIVRLYCNILPDHAPNFIECLTSTLNTKRIKYSIKILNNPEAYTRPDTAVLYLAHDTALSIWQDLRLLYREQRNAFAHGTPAFAKPLADGIAVAEEPEVENALRMSFGQHRSFLVAQGLLHAFQHTNNAAEKRYQSIVDNFREKKLMIEKPYLNANAEDAYEAFSVEEGW